VYDIFLPKQEVDLIVDVDVGVGVAEVTSTVMMVVAAATVGDGLITLEVVEVVGALVEDLGAEVLNGVVAVATITVAAVGMEAGGHLLPPLMLVVEAGEQQLLVALVLVMTQDGAVPRRWFQHRMAVVGAGVLAVVEAGEGCAVLFINCRITMNWKLVLFESC
jgi:hypothetical protein